ncbi:MAG: hypothetical protein LBF41_08435 [Deltaproteobacteria bacterium]|jgi:hypothetical protein|nr:hypothetical protein [Deltaproteobacteria bacterium]
MIDETDGDMDVFEGEEGEVPGRPGVDWFWVLVSPITVSRDKMLVLEVDGEDVAPVFKNKEDGESFAEKVNPPDPHRAQAMHADDIRDFARLEALRVVTCDGEGTIEEVWEDRDDYEEGEDDGDDAEYDDGEDEEDEEGEDGEDDDEDDEEDEDDEDEDGEDEDD